MPHHLYLLPRGVHIAPCLGPHDERIFFAVDSRHRLVNKERVMVPPGENPEPAMERLWDLLNNADPIPALRSIAAQVGAAVALMAC